MCVCILFFLGVSIHVCAALLFQFTSLCVFLGILCTYVFKNNIYAVFTERTYYLKVFCESEFDKENKS